MIRKMWRTVLFYDDNNDMVRTSAAQLKPPPLTIGMPSTAISRGWSFGS